MPTPVVYQGGEIDLLASTPAPRQSPDLTVFYATSREASRDGSDYSNDVSSSLRVGTAVIRFGDESQSWDSLRAASIVEKRPRPVVLALRSHLEMATFADDGIERSTARPGASQQAWFDAIDAELAISPTDDIIVYIHGAKVNFYNGCVFAAELDHFLGRRMVPVAFCWPTHQDILSYVDGEDIGRGQEAAYALAGLLLQLSRHTAAERIHVVCWSAGGRVTSKALALLREAFPGLDRAELREAFRLGTVVFAAADVEVGRFMGRLREIDEMAERVIITVAEVDEALTMSKATIRGDQRLGLWRDEGSREREVLRESLVTEVIDVSYLSTERGFDIKGHRYWFRHPWVSSDLVIAILLGLPAAERGLIRADDPREWAMPPDYPDRVRRIAAPLLLTPDTAPAAQP